MNIKGSLRKTQTQKPNSNCFFSDTFFLASLIVPFRRRSIMAWTRTSMGRIRFDGNEDRLSDLPECIILHILSFLTIQHAVQTCVLSTRWKHLWKRIPTLNLNSHEFRTLKIFSVFLSKILSLHDTSTALYAVNLIRGRTIEPRLLKRFLNYVISHNTHLQQLGISVCGDTGLVFNCISSCRALTSLTLSVRSKWSDLLATLFPKSLNLPLLTSLDLKHFVFCGDENGCAEPFLAFTKLKSLVIFGCKVRDAQILSISNNTLVNLAMHYNSSLHAKIKLNAPSLSTFTYTGSHHIHEICGSGLSSVKKLNIKSAHFSASKYALVLFNWLINFANIESLTVTSTVLQILSLVPDVLKVKLRCFHNLKSLKVELIQIREGSLILLIKEAMIEKAAAKSPKEVVTLRKAFETSFEPPAIPHGIVDFLRQNSPSAEVNISTEYPCFFNLKQIEESIKGVNINNYRSRFSMRSSARLPRLSVRSSSSVAPGLAAKSASAAEPASDAAPASAAEPAKSASAAEPASDAAPASAAEPATAGSPNLHMCLGEKDDKSSNKDEEEKQQHNTDSPLQDNGQ
ncbi:putative F-box/FBD/LRR-repeat protein At1g78760 [Lathyrus oleraceus]|nr:putative F-box/FBD/LRR-repeat protein At1g78760 [Pisum sativum]